MRPGTLAALLLCGTALLSPAAQAAEGFATQLYLKTDLGPQLIAADTPLPPGSQVRLEIVASEPATLSVQWQPVGGEAQSLASDVRLEAGKALSVPGRNTWIELGAGDGRESFLVFATDSAGNVEQEQVAYIILDRAVAAIDQTTFGALRTRQPAGPPAATFSSYAFAVPPSAAPADTGAGLTALAAAAPAFDGIQTRAFAAQLAKVPAEAATYASSGANLFKKVANGVVLVLTNDGIGSGSVISADGEILTNWHVVEDYKVVGVVFRPPQGTPLSEDMILLADVEKVSVGQDLALLKLRQVPANTIVLPLGTMANVDIGNEVHAVGHPKGESWTYTRGYVSQIRDGYRWSYEDGTEHLAQVIQTQTPINPGNSGGPLFDDDGTVIGVNSFINQQAAGLNYAVSIAEVDSFLAATPVAANTAPGGTQKPPMPPPPPAPGATQPPAAPPPPPATANAAPEYFPIDENNNGKPEAYGADRNGDGAYDVIVFDENEDGIPEYAYFDNDFNGVVDMQVVSTEDKEGPFDLWMVDADEDGQVEMYGFDWDQDGTVDEWSPA